MDKDFGEFPICTIKEINRARNSINFFYRQKQAAKKIMVRFEVLKKSLGLWRPFIYNFTIDFCEFMGKENNAVMKLGFTYLKPYLTLKNSCPFKVHLCGSVVAEFNKIRISLAFGFIRTMKALWIIFLVLLSSLNVETKFKSLHCTNYDESLGVILLCRIKAINRYRNSISIQFRQKTTVNNVHMRLEFFKRANGWRPFLYNFTFNVCDFLKSRNNMIIGLAYEYVRPYLPIGNYTCPFKKNHLLKCTDLEFDVEKFRLRFPIETGEYALQLSWIVRKKVTLTLNGSMEYYNYREH
ncbi:uncharacterized protein Dana_GF12501 [Drosophila ananassae]|uniref:MD-2-related lipid-recognition domain-containing protein n=1 Tax=Drosophila ananassae TaxID=7217 RepID=A0A0P8XLS5_DROAN|nr:uncharacterized protein LOC6495351 [Drosophila ananassae]KPU75670.1 uncharacterized protein Dana_GF12501 [Drosophila ananassae]